MKKQHLLCKLLTVLCVTVLFFTMMSCRSRENEGEETTIPDTIEMSEEPTETIPGTESEETTSAQTGEEESNSPSKVYQTGTGPDYSDYLNRPAIDKALKDTGAIAIALDANRIYQNGDFQALDSPLVTKENGTLTVDPALVAKATGKIVTGNNLFEIANSMQMAFAVYDNRLVLFYKGTQIPLDLFDDCYTYEALYLYLIDANEEEIANAFIQLPDLVTDGAHTASFYNAPDLNLGLQTSVYRNALGRVDGVEEGPALVAGEGRNENNHTLVRVYNRSQACIAQFLAFDSRVTGGVQVAAGTYSHEGTQNTVIATAPYLNEYKAARKVRIYDTWGTLRTEIAPDSRIAAPYVIATGHFLPDVADEVLLITSAATDQNGYLWMSFCSLRDGSVYKTCRLDCSFAKEDSILLSVRENDTKPDHIILYFTQKNCAYEGNAAEMQLENIGIQLPANASGVYPSANFGEKYIVTLKKAADTENQSFVTIYDYSENVWGNLVDVGFRENVFYSNLAEDNDSGYVDHMIFRHLRVEFGCGALGKVLQASANGQTVEEALNNTTLDDWRFGGLDGQRDAYRTEGNTLLEPCFTHRWNKIESLARLSSYKDEDGNPLYASIGRDNNTSTYLEIGSEFYIGTYADANIDLAKLRLLPLRDYVRGMSATFRGAEGIPERLVGISPVHEHEINVAGSIGDYNINMVKGFASYLLEQYGSVENINRLFGTPFANADEIDPPRDGAFGERGDWDKYSGKYFQQWSLYNRYIVNKRIMEAYRETMLAGFPPEAITAHQIPEGDAVSGFLGEADTRLSPIDVVMSAGTAFGATRYGMFINDKTNFIAVAHRSGHKSIELGEYCSLSISSRGALKQLEYLWKNGVRCINNLWFSEKQLAAEQAATLKLAQKNLPRPGYTGGTISTMGVRQGSSSYNIVQVGDADNEGLLKSVTSDGKWEGTVYLVPFHSHINVESLPMTAKTNTANHTGAVTGLQNGDQVEISFLASAKKGSNASVKIEVYHEGCKLENATVTYAIREETGSYRYVYLSQLAPENIEIVVTFHEESGNTDAITVEQMSATLQTESIGKKYFDGAKGALEKSAPHLGGVSFDLLTREMK